ncbi:MAG: hypothetical protein PHU49_12840 [Syntrophorhabdaceae bacterium]|nr:hypothetical protein [Syntrophorhabdaceae bacterium]MDD5244893.1 hypothetical protein [Syntrophorhabdaceae bacterium]
MGGEVNQEMNGKKKNVEYRYLKSFLSLLRNGLDISNDDIECRESPDFIINLGNKRIGIEITEHHSSERDANKRSRRATEEDWEVLRTTIRDRVWKDSDLSQTYGYLEFKKLELPPRKKFRSFTDEIIQLSKEMIHTHREVVKIDEKYPLLYKYMNKMHLKIVRCFITWDWNYEGGSVGLTETELIKTIELKTSKASGYVKNDIDELWLIIVEGHRISQAMGLNLEWYLDDFNSVNSLLQGSRFNKVYIYQYMHNLIYEWPRWIKIGQERFIETIKEPERSNG